MSIAVNWGSVTHVGSVRSVNQDAVLAGPVVFAVADGMGGHAAGEVASAIAIARLARLAGQESQDEIVAAIVEANAEILAQGMPGSGREGMGTTLSGVAFARLPWGEALLVFNVGDSRTYVYGQAGLRQVSTDHSVVAEMVRNGELASSDAQTHPARNVVTRALGVDSDLEVDCWWIEPTVGDRILLCSDGLTNEVSEVEITSVLRESPEPQVAVDALLARALGAGGHDNISVVVLQILGVADSPGEVDEDTHPRTGRSGSGATEEAPIPETHDLIRSVPGNQVPASTNDRTAGTPGFIEGLQSRLDSCR